VNNTEPCDDTDFRVAATLILIMAVALVLLVAGAWEVNRIWSPIYHGTVPPPVITMP
jgi:hypothetical protein